MNSFFIVLYILGLLGISSSIVILGLKIHKKRKIYNYITLILIMVSFILLSLGTILGLMNIKNNSLNSVNKTEIDTSEASIASYKDLSFIYRFSNSNSSNNKNAYISIDNNSSLVFTGIVHLKFLDQNNSTVSTLNLPVKNLIPNTSTKSNIQVDMSVSKIEYSFNGKFETVSSNSESSYKIKDLAYGDNYLRIEVIANSSDLDTLNNICRELKETYTYETTIEGSIAVIVIAERHTVYNPQRLVVVAQGRVTADGDFGRTAQAGSRGVHLKTCHLTLQCAGYRRVAGFIQFIALQFLNRITQHLLLALDTEGSNHNLLQ